MGSWELVGWLDMGGGMPDLSTLEEEYSTTDNETMPVCCHQVHEHSCGRMHLLVILDCTSNYRCVNELYPCVTERRRVCTRSSRRTA